MSLFTFTDDSRGAVLASGEKYRYQLWRIWDNKLPKVMFIMLNPSTGDATKDDPTIRRCIGFAKSWGYGGFYVGNLFAFRSKNPIDLLHVFSPVGKENNFHLKSMSDKCELIVCAWGNSYIMKKINYDGNPLDKIKKPFHCIDQAKDGTPKHPLYLPGDLKPKPL